jgi:hypothetical protein
VIGREHRVGAAVAGTDLGRVVDDEQAGVQDQLDAAGCERA